MQPSEANKDVFLNALDSFFVVKTLLSDLGASGGTVWESEFDLTPEEWATIEEELHGPQGQENGGTGGHPSAERRRNNENGCARLEVVPAAQQRPLYEP